MNKDDYKKIREDSFPETMTIQLGDQTLRYKKRKWKRQDGSEQEAGLRYGENPDQEAALYELVDGNLVLGDCTYVKTGQGLVSSIPDEDILQAGKHPGMTNFTDVDAALNVLKYFSEEACCVIVKHNNPSGVAVRKTLKEAYIAANFADRIAAFGGAVVVNRKIDVETAAEMAKYYIEIICAPDYDDEAIKILKGRKNLRIIRMNNIDRLHEYQNIRYVDFKSLIDGGIVVQQSPILKIKKKEDFETAHATYKNQTIQSERKPTAKEYEDMLFGWRVEQGITSNSVIFVKDKTTIGIGTGEQDRLSVVKIAALKAYEKYADKLSFEKTNMPYIELQEKIAKGEADEKIRNEIDVKVHKEKGNLIGSIMISDAFFPFRDAVDEGIKHGTTGIVHPGGSIRDYDSIIACNEAEPKVTMVFTGQRAFKH